MTSNGNRKRKPSSGQRSNNSSRSRQSSSTNKKRTNTKSRSTASKKNDTQEFDYVKLLIYIGIFAVLVLMFLFALGIFEGGLGLFITNFVKGVFGFNAFIIPIVGIITVIYYIFTETTKKTVFNIVSAVIFVTSIGLFAHLRYKAISAVTYSEAVGIYYHEGKGGGVLFGSLAYLIDITCGRALIWILAIILIIASIAVKESCIEVIDSSSAIIFHNLLEKNQFVLNCFFASSSLFVLSTIVLNNFFREVFIVSFL